jgi:hypothetical protein
MIYTAAITEYVRRSPRLHQEFGAELEGSELNLRTGASPGIGLKFEEWMVTDGYKTSAPVREYLDFLHEMREAFMGVEAGLRYKNVQAKHKQGDDLWATGCAGESMIPIAAYLYYLHSNGVTGGILECGCFKGGSTCCLSLICSRLGLKLYAADSFEGLPDQISELDTYYGAGEFCGSEPEVRGNVEKFGDARSVEFIRGWFSESLKGFSQELAIIWLDVDLKQSMLDALGHAFPNLNPRGVIFSDGLGEHRDFAGDQLIPATGESSGLCEYFAENQVPHKAIHSGWGYIGLVIPNAPPDTHILYRPQKLKFLLENHPKRRRFQFWSGVSKRFIPTALWELLRSVRNRLRQVTAARSFKKPPAA